jgi:hypothetical protein
MNPLAAVELLLPHPDDTERVEMRAKLSSGRIVQRWLGSADEVLRTAARLRGADIWFGPGLRAGSVGDAAHVTRLQALWCDVDAKCFKGSKRDALVAIASLPFSPSLVIDTGGGFQPYWRLESPVDARRIGSEARTAMRGIRAALEAYADRGLDRVDDLSRVLRLPGSWNRKYEPPRSVSIAASSRATYTLDDFRAANLWQPRESPRASPTVRARPLTPPPPLPRWVEQALSFPEQFVRQSPSELDFAVMCRLVEVIGPQQAEEIWISSPLGAREKVQARPDYRERTIRAALAATFPEKSEGTSSIRIRVG